MANPHHTTNWPDLAVGLYDRLTGRHAEITYELDDMHVQVPSGTGPEAEHAEWILSGALFYLHALTKSPDEFGPLRCHVPLFVDASRLNVPRR